MYVTCQGNRHHVQRQEVLDCTAHLCDVSNVNKGVRPLLADAIHQAVDNLCDVCVVVPATARSQALGVAPRTMRIQCVQGSRAQAWPCVAPHVLRGECRQCPLPHNAPHRVVGFLAHHRGLLLSLQKCSEAVWCGCSRSTTPQSRMQHHARCRAHAREERALTLLHRSVKPCFSTAPALSRSKISCCCRGSASMTVCTTRP